MIIIFSLMILRKDLELWHLGVKLFFSNVTCMLCSHKSQPSSLLSSLSPIFLGLSVNIKKVVGHCSKVFTWDALSMLPRVPFQVFFLVLISFNSLSQTWTNSFKSKTLPLSACFQVSRWVDEMLVLQKLTRPERCEAHQSEYLGMLSCESTGTHCAVVIESQWRVKSDLVSTLSTITNEGRNGQYS